MMLPLLLAVALGRGPVPVETAAVRVVVERAPLHPMLDRFLREVGGTVGLPTRVETATGTLVEGPAPGTVVLLTCHHALAGARAVRVELPDGREVQLDARAWWVAAGVDLAGITLPRGELSPLALAPRWPADGETVRAAGLAEARDLVVRDGATEGVVDHTPPGGPPQQLGLVSASIAPGMSGGPVVDTLGRLVGVVVAGTTPGSAWGGSGMVVPVGAVRAALAAPPPVVGVVRSTFDAEAKVTAVDPVGAVLGLRRGDQVVAVSDHVGPPALLAERLAGRAGPVVVQRGDGTSIVVP